MVGKFDGVIFISFIDTPDSSYSELNGAPNHGSGIGGLNMYMRLGAVNTKYFNRGGHGEISDELLHQSLSIKSSKCSLPLVMRTTVM